MSRAQVERVGEDVWAARDFLEQARKLLADGQVEGIQASYRAGSLNADGVDEAVQAVRELVTSAEELIEPRLPGWEASWS